jgi:hypothetical protein
MPEPGTAAHPSKIEHRLRIRLGGHLSQFSQFLYLRMPGAPDANKVFHVSNSHAKVDPKFVIDNMGLVLAAGFETGVEDGDEGPVAREAVIDLGRGDLAHFHSNGIRIFSSSFERASNKLAQILNVYRISEARRGLPSKSSNLGSRAATPAEQLTSMLDEPKLRVNYACTMVRAFHRGRSRF